MYKKVSFLIRDSYLKNVCVYTRTWYHGTVVRYVGRHLYLYGCSGIVVTKTEIFTLWGIYLSKHD